MNEVIERHLKGLYDKESFGDVPYERVEESWLTKEELFTGQSSNLKLQEVDLLNEEDGRAFLALTFSGSLLAYYVDEGDGPRLEYSSIKMREDVPSLIVESSIALTSEIKQGACAEFSSRMLKKTSPLYRIAAAPEDLSPEAMNKRISEAMIFLSNGFVKINKTFLTSGSGDGPDHFTKKTMNAYLAQKHGLSQKAVKAIMDDFDALMETGVLMGERVPFGQLGKVYADLRPAQKARVGRNPATGEEMTIGAKPATFVPKISFSSSFKEKVARKVTPEEDE